MILKSSHQQSGQAIAEGAAFLVILIPLMLALVMLTLYIGTSSYYHLMLAQVADAGARSAVNERYWQGSPRPDFDATKSGPKITALVTNLWQRIGLPGTVTTVVDMSSPDIVAVTVSATGLPIPAAAFLPDALALKSTAAEPYNIDRPIGVLMMGIYSATNTIIGGMGTAVPCYGGGTASGVYAPKTPGPSGGDIGPGPYWYTDLFSPTNPGQHPIKGPFADYNMLIPYPM